MIKIILRIAFLGLCILLLNVVYYIFKYQISLYILWVAAMVGSLTWLCCIRPCIRMGGIFWHALVVLFWESRDVYIPSAPLRGSITHLRKIYGGNKGWIVFGDAMSRRGVRVLPEQEQALVTHMVAMGQQHHIPSSLVHAVPEGLSITVSDELLQQK